jgi:hypothetical protein
MMSTFLFVAAAAFVVLVVVFDDDASAQNVLLPRFRWSFDVRGVQ